MLILKAENSETGIYLPTTVKELIGKFDCEVSLVTLPKHYCIVGLALHTRLFDLALVNPSSNSNKDIDIEVNPILIKIGDEDKGITGFEPYQLMVTNRSAIERGVHLHLPTCISYNTVISYINRNSTLKTNIINNTHEMMDEITHEMINVANCPKVITMQFKIMPVVDIFGCIPIISEMESTLKDNFKYVESPMDVGYN